MPPSSVTGRYRGPRAYVQFRLRGKPIEFMIDTGFDGSLAVTEEQALELDLESIGPSVVRWFDGTEAPVELAKGNLEWFGRSRECVVHVVRRGFTLIGMELLRETRVLLEYPISKVELTYLVVRQSQSCG